MKDIRDIAREAREWVASNEGQRSLSEAIAQSEQELDALHHRSEDRDRLTREFLRDRHKIQVRRME